MKISKLLMQIIYKFNSLSLVYLFIIKHVFQAKCVWRHPPGDEIYRKATISVFEVDGKKNKVHIVHCDIVKTMFVDKYGKHLLFLNVFLCRHLLKQGRGFCI